MTQSQSSDSTTTTPVSDLAALLRAETSAFTGNGDVLQADSSGVLIALIEDDPAVVWWVQWPTDYGYANVALPDTAPLRAVADVALALHARLTKESAS